MLGAKGIKITPRVSHISTSHTIRFNALPKNLNRQIYNPTTYFSASKIFNFKSTNTLSLVPVRRFASQSNSKQSQNQNQKDEQNENKTQYEEVFTPGGPDPAPKKHSWGMEALSFAEGALFLMLAYILGYYTVKLYYRDDFNASAEEKKKEEGESNDTKQQSKDSSVPVNFVEDEMPPLYKYVIIGAGTAGTAAWEAIKENDPNGNILLIGSEPDHPYLRPPLSKELWGSEDPDVRKNLNFTAFDGTPHNVYFHPETAYSDGRTTFLSRTVKDMDVPTKSILLEDGSIVRYEKLLIASGGQPKFISGVDPTAREHLQDFRKLHELTDSIKDIVVIGGGFLGSELSCSLAKKGKKTGMHVTQVFPENGILALVFPKYLSDYVTAKVGSELGVDVKPERLVKTITKTPEGKVEVTLDDGTVLKTDHVVVAAGIRPDPQFAAYAAIENDDKNGGIVVNTELQARTDIYAAGDVASYYDETLGRRRRVEHHDHAVASGKHAGRNMTGKTDPYSYLPFFWSDIGPFGFEAVGITDANLKTVSVWEKDEKNPDNKSDFKKGIVYYLNKDDRVVGAILWNTFGKVDDARRVIRKREVFGNPENMKNQISLEDEHH